MRNCGKFEIENIMSNNVAKDKSIIFAIRIVKLYKYLTETKNEIILSKQILRSGTSIGANIAESEYAISGDDFTSKVYISLKECSETEYWLKLLYSTDYITKEQFDSIYADCEELRKILSSITKTMKDKKGIC